MALTQNIYITEKTTTFQMPIEYLAQILHDQLNTEFETSYGKVVLTQPVIDWIVQNFHDSHSENGNIFVYNKDLLSFVNTQKVYVEEEVFVFDLIREWAELRGLYAKGDMKTQYCKLGEESGELGRAIIKNDRPEVIDAIGDMIVVLTNIAKLADTHFKSLDPNSETITIESCIESAYKVIASRTGHMKNGSFIKD